MARDKMYLMVINWSLTSVIFYDSISDSIIYVIAYQCAHIINLKNESRYYYETY